MMNYEERDGLRFYSKPFKVRPGEYIESHYGCRAAIDDSLNALGGAFGEETPHGSAAE